MSLPFPPQSYELSQLVRILERQSSDFVIKGSIALSAPLTEVTEVNTQANGKVAITQSSLTLGGITGSLPEHITELLHQRIAEKDQTLLDFLDILHHPLFCLSYQAWKNANFAVAFEQNIPDKTDTTALLESSTGLSRTFINEDIGDVHRYFAGLFNQRTRPGTALCHILRCHFNLPVQIQYFAGRWANIDQRETTCLSSQLQCRQHNQLGKDCLVGKRTWLTQNYFTLTIGPLHYQQYERLLPNGDIYIALQELAQIYCGDSLTPRITLTLKDTHIPRCQLSQNSPMRLGWTTWLKTNDGPGGQNHIQFGQLRHTPIQ